VHAAAETGGTGGLLRAARWARSNKRSGPFPDVEDDVLRAVAELRAATEEWLAVRPGGRLELAWPLPVQPPPRPATSATGAGARAGASAGREVAHADAISHEHRTA